jgi:hypothetical protein
MRCPAARRCGLGFLETARFVGLDTQKTQFKLGGRPCEIHCPVNGMGIAVFAHQIGDLLARGPGGQNQRHLYPLTRRQP